MARVTGAIGGRMTWLLAGAVACAAMLCAALAGARADSIDRQSVWLPRIDSLADALRRTPREFLQNREGSAEDRFLVELGAVVFRAPDVLGLEARTIGLTCATCHAGGDVNRGFFLRGLAHKPGIVDLTSTAFHRPADDGKYNPLRIPSLRGIAATAPYGFRGTIATLEGFARHVIEDEFGGNRPKPVVMRALVAYMNELAMAPNPMIDRHGRLTKAAPAAARRGAKIFERPLGKGADGKAVSCASCHIPRRRFIDGRQHDIGTGGKVDTPTLLGVALGGPYFHDGRFDSFEQVLAFFESRYRFTLTDKARADLVAYLKAVGGADRPFEPASIDHDLDQVGRGTKVLAAVVKRADAALVALVVRTIRRDLGLIHDRYRSDAHDVIRKLVVAWSRALQDVRDAADAGDFGRAAAALVRAKDAQHRAELELRQAAPTSLYEPRRLKRFIESRRKKG